MNKELILKYKAEFDHSLYGGKLQVKFVNDPWEEAPEDIFSYSTVNFVLVIDDEYVEFRKAGAEGKQLQVSYNDGKTWFDKSYRKISWSKTQLLRIKPEEPKFKVGDWVRDKKRKHKPFMVTSSDLEADSPNYVKIDCELWKPQLGEWCWFYKGKPYDTPCLRKFITIIDDTYIALNSQNSSHITPTEIPSFVKGISDSYVTYKNCEPFIGQLPTILKE